MGRMIKQIKFGLTLIALLALILFLGFIYTLLRVKDNQTLIATNINKVSTLTETSVKINSGNILANTPGEVIYKGLKLQKGRGNQWETIYDRLEFRPSLFAGDYFIVGSETYGGPNVQVYAFNLKTSKEFVLYDKFDRYIGITQIYQIGNTIFFSTGAYLKKGDMFYIDLPLEQNKIMKVEGNGEIEEVEGRYWIWNGDGDDCWSDGSYSLFDPKNKKITPVAKYFNNCGTGNKLIILTDKVLNLHFVGQGDADHFSTSTYTHVSSIDINTPQKEVDLISKADMPAFIHDIVYDKESNSLLLTGNEKYVFDIYNKTLVKKDFVKPKDQFKYQGTHMDSAISKLKEIKLPEGYRFDFSDKAKY